MPRDPRWAGWPYQFGWLWWASGDAGELGHVRIGHLDTDRWWKFPIRFWDDLAQKHMNDRTVKSGQPMQMPDRRVLEIPYQALDDEADALQRRQMQPHPDRTPLAVVRAKDGTPIQNFPRDFWEQLAASHIERRQMEPPISLRVGQETVTIAYDNFDAIVKDFVRNQRDRFVAAGKWPELLIHEGIANPNKPGPLPVQGRADAFGQGATPGLNQPKPGQGQVGHPAIENQELV